MSQRPTKKEAPATAAPAPPAKKPRRIGRVLIMLLGAVILGGGGLGAALYASGVLDTGGAEANRPHLVPREGVSSALIAEGEAQARSGRINPQVFQATYHQLENNFTSNLSGGTSFVQIGLGVSTYYDARVIEHLEKHDMAIRSAILMALSEQDPVAIATVEGKERLRQVLKNAVNGVLTNKEGFGGIEEVHFTSFVTQ